VSIPAEPAARPTLVPMEQVKLLSPDETRIKITGTSTAQRYLDAGFTIIEIFGDDDPAEIQGAEEIPDSPATGEDQDEPTDETEEV